VSTRKTFQGTHILGASRGLLCDSSVVFYTVVSGVVFTIIQTSCIDDDVVLAHQLYTMRAGFISLLQLLYCIAITGMHVSSM